jgi:hypothetical protein
MNNNTNDGVAALSREEMNDLIDWVSRDTEVIPSKMKAILERLLAVYSNLVQGAQRAKSTLFHLRQAMGFIPKSERGKPDRQAGIAPMSTDNRSTAETMGTEMMSPESRAQYELIRKKRDEFARQKRDYDRKLRSLKAPQAPKGGPPAEQMELDLGKPSEMLFSSPLTARKNVDQAQRQVDRMREFENKTTGLHVSHDFPKRMDLAVVATEITYKVETVTDPVTGKSVRASMREDGPEGFQLTWGAVGNLIKMHVGFAIPIHRMVLMIGQPEFSSSKIVRIMQYVARNLVDIYLHLSEQLSDAPFLSGDDTTTKVLDTTDPGKPDLICDEIDAWLGWAQGRADGSGPKSALNVSLIVGKSEKDPRSTIRFFRTHLGSVGNLLTKLLESRKPKSGSVIFQGDLSNTNLPSPNMREKFKLAIAGCGAHARRPFWRHRNDDEGLCYFMLRGFLALSRLEARINAEGRTREKVLKLRGRYGRLIWLALRNRCIASTTGEIYGVATYPRGISPDIWPPNTELNRAAMYVINHFEALTLYLKHPELEYTNNGQERALRIEKCMLSSSKFRKTKRGRVTLDILRTINATCTAAGVDLTDYLRFVFTHLEDGHVHPERFTPFAFARRLDASKKPAATAATMATMPSN